MTTTETINRLVAEHCVDPATGRLWRMPDWLTGRLLMAAVESGDLLTRTLGPRTYGHMDFYVPIA